VISGRRKTVKQILFVQNADFCFSESP